MPDRGNEIDPVRLRPALDHGPSAGIGRNAEAELDIHGGFHKEML
jgi:hypothetical protein